MSSEEEGVFVCHVDLGGLDGSAEGVTGGSALSWAKHTQLAPQRGATGPRQSMATDSDRRLVKVASYGKVGSDSIAH